MTRPIVVIPCCRKIVDRRQFDGVSRRYSVAVAQAAGCQPLLVPLGDSVGDIGQILDLADGVLLSGSMSNVEPAHYKGGPPLIEEAIDPDRDALTLPMIQSAIARKIPLFAICRGFQELNVALGGTLHQAVHTREGYLDHREPESEDLAGAFSTSHRVRLIDKLKNWVGQDEIMVNSLHWQGIEKLSDRLLPQAHAPDGLIEAVRVLDGHPFTLGVQWHPEWEPQNDPASFELFRRFGDAVRGEKL